MKRWKLKEQSDKRVFKGKKVKGSGNQWYAPGDVSLEEGWLLECKDTSKKSYSLNIDKWKKISNEALFKFLLPAMSIKIQDEVELIVLEKEDFLKLIKPTKKP